MHRSAPSRLLDRLPEYFLNFVFNFDPLSSLMRKVVVAVQNSGLHSSEIKKRAPHPILQTSGVTGLFEDWKIGLSCQYRGKTDPVRRNHDASAGERVTDRVATGRSGCPARIAALAGCRRRRKTGALRRELAGATSRQFVMHRRNPQRRAAAKGHAAVALGKTMQHGRTADLQSGFGR